MVISYIINSLRKISMNYNPADDIESIYSKKSKGLLLHQFFKPSNKNQSSRVNISPENESLQVSHLVLNLNQTFKAHKHIIFERNMPIAQESWVVIKGKVKVFYYDIDDDLLLTKEMNPGDCTMTYRGGHNYKSLEENTIVYEFKTGPYFGIEKDKVLLSNV